MCSCFGLLYLFQLITFNTYLLIGFLLILFSILVEACMQSSAPSPCRFYVYALLSYIYIYIILIYLHILLIVYSIMLLKHESKNILRRYTVYVKGAKIRTPCRPGD